MLSHVLPHGGMIVNYPNACFTPGCCSGRPPRGWMVSVVHRIDWPHPCDQRAMSPQRSPQATSGGHTLVLPGTNVLNLPSIPEGGAGIRKRVASPR